MWAGGGHWPNVHGGAIGLSPMETASADGDIDPYRCHQRWTTTVTNLTDQGLIAGLRNAITH